MKKLTLMISWLLLTGAIANAQEAVLTVMGNATVSVKPTQTTINFNIESKSDSYTGAIKDMIQRVNTITKELKKIKFEDEDIITSTFSVQKGRVYLQNMWKDSGFIATQNLQVTFPQKKERLLEVLNTATNSKAKSEISLSFGLDNKRKRDLKEELIRLAVQDAKMKAEILAQESGYQILGIKGMDYGVHASGPQPLYARTESASFKSMGLQISNLEASNLSFSDNVTIVFILTK